MGKNLNNESELEINKGLAIRNQHFDVYDLIEVHNAYRMAFLQECAELFASLKLANNQCVKC